MLAEIKKKTKYNISSKPLWMTESYGINFGHHLMEKMGWSTGKGLGVNEQGIKEPLKVTYKNDTEGVGYNKEEDNECWIEHQDGFNSFLNQLRSSDESFVVKVEVEKEEVKSLEEKSKVSKVRVHYQKFTRGKDLSRYSKNDLACILGTSKTQKQKSSAEAEKENSFNMNTVSGKSLQDYFQRKWIFPVNVSGNAGNNSGDADDSKNHSCNENYSSTHEEESSQIESEKKCKKRKHNPSSEEVMDVETEITLESNKLENSEKKKKRKKNLESEEEPKIKKRRQNSDDLVNDTSMEITPGKNKKRKSKNLMVEIENGNHASGELELDKNIFETDVSKVDEDLCDSKKKKRKKNHTNNSFQDLNISEEANNVNEESYVSKKELKVNKKKKRAKGETLEEKVELGEEDFSKVQNDSNTKGLYYHQVNEVDSKNENEIPKEESVLKKKKKKKRKDSNNISDLLLNCETNNSESLDVEIINKKMKKKKKAKKEKDVECNENPSDEITNSYKDEENAISANEITPEVKIVKEKKKKKNKKEILREEEEVEFTECCNNQNMKPNFENVNTSNTSEVEVLLEIETVKKKKTEKEKKEKSGKLKNPNNNVIDLCVENFVTDSVKKKNKKEKTETESSIHATDSCLDETNIKNKNEREIAPEVEFLKEKKKKKNKNEKLLEKNEIEFVENNAENAKSDLEIEIIKENEVEVLADTESVKKKKKKKKDKKEKKEVENSKNHVTDISNVYSDGENIENTNENEINSKVRVAEKEKKKKDKKVMVLEEEMVENYDSEIIKPELDEKNIENTNEVEVLVETELVKKKKKKKDKKEKKEVENFKNHITDVTNVYSNGENIENTNEVEVLVETESVKKKKKKKDKKEKDKMINEIEENSNNQIREENEAEEVNEKKGKKQKKHNNKEHGNSESEKSNQISSEIIDFSENIVTLNQEMGSNSIKQNF